MCCTGRSKVSTDENSPLRLRLKKFQFAWASIGLLLLVFSLPALEVKAQVTPPSPVPLSVPYNPIVDNAHVIDAETRARLEQIYRDLKQRGNIEFAVLTRSEERRV